MTGHDILIAHRKAGRVVRDGVVYIDADGQKINRDWPQYGEYAGVSIDPADYPETLDFRFAKGLLAKVEGCDADRVERITQAVKRYAARTISVHFSWDGYRAEVLRMTDTEGVMNWPK